ncbi:MAG: V-type ATP synthase subunit F, partial [Synergistaceae bacterium]|nr:V-type ATP synthase subunit F [Synergistaceae bacterium]
MADNKPMAAIGSYEMVVPFQAVGVKSVVLTSENRNIFEDTLEQLAREDYAVVFIQEDLFVEFTGKVEEIN